MFYVSNRKDGGEKAATIDDMKELGFTGVSEQTLFLKKTNRTKHLVLKKLKNKVMKSCFT
ncbi:lipoprotein E [Actinobacillus equuli]|nr:lipoprotein E [Actinobacillus equuli]